MGSSCCWSSSMVHSKDSMTRVDQQESEALRSTMTTGTRKTRGDLLAAPAPKKSLSSLPIVELAAGGELIWVPVLPTPQGSTMLIERPLLSCLAAGSAAFHESACEADTGCHPDADGAPDHARFDVELAEFRSLDSTSHGSSMKQTRPRHNEFH